MALRIAVRKECLKRNEIPEILTVQEMCHRRAKETYMAYGDIIDSADGRLPGFAGFLQKEENKCLETNHATR